MTAVSDQFFGPSLSVVASSYEQPVQIFQQLTRSGPSGRDDVRQVPARYGDYLFVAFTASFGFGPADAPPLTRRAKALMLLQAVISVVTLTAIAGSAINILAG